MKKIVAVLVLALVAMTAVFAAVELTNSNTNLKVSLTVDQNTQVAFTNSNIGSTATELQAITDETVRVGDNEFFASFISTEKSKIKITVSVPAFMDHETSTVTDKIQLNNGEAVTKTFTEANNPTTKRSGSYSFTVKVGDTSGKMSGKYSANITMTVTTEG